MILNISDKLECIKTSGKPLPPQLSLGSENLCEAEFTNERPKPPKHRCRHEAEVANPISQTDIHMRRERRQNLIAATDTYSRRMMGSKVI
jgi:hypothetical protein